MNTVKPDLTPILSRKPTPAEQAAFDLIWKLPKGLTKDLFKKKGVDLRAADALVAGGALVVIDGGPDGAKGVYSVPVKLREAPEETPEEAKAKDEAEALRARAASPKAVEVEARLSKLLADLAEGADMPVVSAEDQADLGLEHVDGETADKTLERHRALFPKVEDPKVAAKTTKEAIKAAQVELDTAVRNLTEGKGDAEAVKAARTKLDGLLKDAGKPTEPKAAKAPKESKMGPCLDGCGAMVKRPTNFVPGHDAKFKSILLKVVTRAEAEAKRDGLIAAGKADEAAKVKIPDAPEVPRLTGEDGEHQKAYVHGAAWATPAMKALFQ